MSLLSRFVRLWHSMGHSSMAIESWEIPTDFMGKRYGHVFFFLASVLRYTQFSDSLGCILRILDAWVPHGQFSGHISATFCHTQVPPQIFIEDVLRVLLGLSQNGGYYKAVIFQIKLGHDFPFFASTSHVS